MFAFERRLGGRRAVVAVPRLVTQLIPGGNGLPLGHDAWDDTVLSLGAGGGLRDVFTGRTFPARPSLPAAQVFEHFPVALLVSDE